MPATGSGTGFAGTGGDPPESALTRNLPDTKLFIYRFPVYLANGSHGSQRQGGDRDRQRSRARPGLCQGAGGGTPLWPADRSAPAISPGSTRPVTSTSSTGSRTCTSPAARTSIRPRSNRPSSSIRASRKSRSSGCRTRSGARLTRPSSFPGRALRWMRTRCVTSSGSGWRNTRSPFTSMSALPRTGSGKVRKADLRSRPILA
jgi:hypothetical protein